MGTNYVLWKKNRGGGRKDTWCLGVEDATLTREVYVESWLQNSFSFIAADAFLALPKFDIEYLQNCAEWKSKEYIGLCVKHFSTKNPNLSSGVAEKILKRRKYLKLRWFVFLPNYYRISYGKEAPIYSRVML